MKTNLPQDYDGFGNPVRVRHMVKARRILLLMVFIILFSGISGLVAISGFANPDGVAPSTPENSWELDLAELDLAEPDLAGGQYES